MVRKWNDLYLSEVHKLSIDPEVIRRQKDLCIVYTPLHGAGRVLVPASLKLWGFENVHTVPEQMVKDGNFPTVVSPNPENGEALTLALNLAKNLNADIVMASDPDADRVGMACKDNEGEWVLIDGNQTCMIFLYYIIKNRIAMGKMKGDEYIVKTIVTTELIKEIADKNKVKCTMFTPASSGLLAPFVCSKAKKPISAVGKRATVSWDKILCATKMPCLPAPCLLKSVHGRRIRQDPLRCAHGYLPRIWFLAEPHDQCREAR